LNSFLVLTKKYVLTNNNPAYLRIPLLFITFAAANFQLYIK